MRKLDNLYALYEQGRRMGTLRAMLKSKQEMDGELGGQLWECWEALRYLINGKVIPLPRSSESAAKLGESIGKMMNGDPGVGRQEYGTFLNGYFTGPIKEDLETFQIALSEELKGAAAYFVDAEGNLSTEKLLSGAHAGYPLHVKNVLSQQCKDEIDEAGRCIVFERATAVGFHILRSVELAVKEYLAKIPAFTMPPLNRQNWGEYIELLKDNGAAKEVRDTLQAIKDNHRNPLMHPEDTLSLHEAVSLFSVCQSMTEALVRDLQKRKLI